MISHKLKSLQKMALQRVEEDQQFLALSPLVRAKRYVQKQIDDDIAYRLGILRDRSVFERMNSEELATV
jgi:hypothetical protein